MIQAEQFNLSNKNLLSSERRTRFPFSNKRNIQNKTQWTLYHITRLVSSLDLSWCPEFRQSLCIQDYRVWGFDIILQVISSPHLTPVLFWGCFLLFGCIACSILVPWPGIKPSPPAMEALTLNLWTTREVPTLVIFKGHYAPNDLISELTQQFDISVF